MLIKNMSERKAPIYKDDTVWLEERGFMFVEVRVLEYRRPYGRELYKITPVKGEGVAEVERVSLLTKSELKAELEQIEAGKKFFGQNKKD